VKEWITKDRLNEVIKSIGKLAKMDVLVGIPESENARNDEAPNNAALGYLHEHGSPANNIPARPFLVPGVAEAKNKFRPRLANAAKMALEGNLKDALKQLDAAGIEAENSAKRKINSGDFVPLADATLRARAARGRVGAGAELARRAEGFAAGTQLAKPLIDTGQLRNSITHVVREKK
jgi:hypothetical protein